MRLKTFYFILEFHVFMNLFFKKLEVNSCSICTDRGVNLERHVKKRHQRQTLKNQRQVNGKIDTNEIKRFPVNLN